MRQKLIKKERMKFDEENELEPSKDATSHFKERIEEEDAQTEDYFSCCV